MCSTSHTRTRTHTHNAYTHIQWRPDWHQPTLAVAVAAIPRIVDFIGERKFQTNKMQSIRDGVKWPEWMDHWNGKIWKFPNFDRTWNREIVWFRISRDGRDYVWSMCLMRMIMVFINCSVAYRTAHNLCSCVPLILVYHYDDDDGTEYDELRAPSKRRHK